MIKKFIFLFALICYSFTQGYSQNVTEINGIQYRLFPKSKEANVVAKEGGYSGSVNIPAKLTIDYEPYSVSGIESGAFSDCANLSEVTLPSSIALIQPNAFTNVPAGLKIYLNKSKLVTFVKMNSFDDSCFKNATLYLPTESILKEYKKYGPWFKFENTGIVPKAKSDGVDRRTSSEKWGENKRTKKTSRSKTIKF